jgi:hypothetical protein
VAAVLWTVAEDLALPGDRRAIRFDDLEIAERAASIVRRILDRLLPGVF